MIELHSEKHGQHGAVRLNLLFTPEIIAKTRKNTSTFSSAGRAVTQIGSLPLGAGKGVVHGVGHVGKAVHGVFSKDYAKEGNGKVIDSKDSAEPPSTVISAPTGASQTQNGSTMTFPSLNTEIGRAHV